MKNLIKLIILGSVLLCANAFSTQVILINKNLYFIQPYQTVKMVPSTIPDMYIKPFHCVLRTCGTQSPLFTISSSNFIPGKGSTADGNYILSKTGFLTSYNGKWSGSGSLEFFVTMDNDPQSSNDVISIRCEYDS